MPIAAEDYATTQSATVVVSVPASQRIKVHTLSLSVPDGQSASVSIGSDEITQTRGSSNMKMVYSHEGANGDDLTVTSSGAVAVTLQYDLV